MKKTTLFFVSLILILNFVPSTEVGATTSLAYQYDANGNLIQGDGKYFEYNEANQLVRVRHGGANGPVIAQYFYDYRGQRVKKIENGIVTYYIGKHYVSQVDGNTVTNTNYYFANGERVAKKDSSGNISYYLNDHLGGTNDIIDNSGNLVERTTYYPFGDIRQGGSERFTYTGKEKDKFTDSFYFESRYYNPTLKYFNQGDKYWASIYSPQARDRYSYVYNNPLKYSDPTGHWPKIPSWNDIINYVNTGVNWVESKIQKYGPAVSTASVSIANTVTNNPQSTFSNVMHSTSGIISKALTFADVSQKVSDSITFNKQSNTNQDPRISPQFSKASGDALQGLRYIENAFSFGLSKQQGGDVTGGGALLGSHNLTDRDAKRYMLDAYKAKHLVDVYTDPNASEQQIEEAEQLYDDPTSSPYFPK